MKFTDIKLTQRDKQPKKSQMDGHPHWIVIFPYQAKLTHPDKFPYAPLLISRRKQLGRNKADTEAISMDLPNAIGSHVAFACLEPATVAFKLLTIARKLIDIHYQRKVTNIHIAIAGFDSVESERIVESLIAAASAVSAEMPSYKRDKQKYSAITKLELYGIKVRHGFKRTLSEAEGNAVARYLSMLPSNKLTPSIYLKYIRGLVKEHKWKLDFYDVKALQKKKAGAFLAVVQGSPTQDAGIVRLRYAPSFKSKRGKVTLVGKGICYDTGGTNLKPAKFMYGMQEDMQGSAVALGTFLALTRLKANFAMECWLAVAMNHIGPRAYKQNDVITASDGTSIEVVHTDAEGRLVLADALLLACKQKPRLIIDYATLTGACVYSLGTAYSGVFTNKDSLIQTLIEAGRDSGERVWPFPIDEDYDTALDSNIADIKQCSLEAEADHILAARFLQRFVKKDIPWIHIDLSSSNHKGGLAHISTDTTGFGIRYTLNLLLDKKLI